MAKTLAKIQVTAIFLLQDTRRSQIYRDLSAGKPTETSFTEVCYKRRNLSLEELKND